MKKNRGLTPLAAILMLSGSMLLTGCDNKGAQQAGQQQSPEVGVVTLKTVPLTVTTDLPGRTSSFRIAEVRPQVSGIILKRNFVEGSDIKAGESLYQIDPATYQAAYDSARGDLVQAQANAQIAALTVKRYKPLLGTKYISQQDYDTAVATASQTAAAVQVAKASVETARINLAFTKVTSPISGRIGKSSVTEGALVQNAQTTAMATVQQLDPIYVDVTQSSEDFMRLRAELNSGKLQQAGGKAQVTLLLQNGNEYAQSGTLEFSDVTVDETTGSITLRAVFPNPEHALLPGMFVRARLTEGTNPNALLVPQQAVTRSPTGQATAMVVDADNKVVMRNLTTEQAIGDKWLVTDGLKAGEKVITTGVQRAKPGIQVTPQEVSTDDAGKAKSVQPQS
ncbi:efflux RND transporter periplasmic adaptor subunit [Erwinia psidii]|uniref:Efflux RND transporter periplasmic adaptor subunit n=1 Tax=Erwinia psidii TaxID=69224 RepID=A0A3N6SD83_9GAMM|nr:efflux RND transporter periplasmic adaptor subunit [Erwinia psidii]MCX8958035.1 efflux RND transporter periplasmic adaptor subunit [Erwinia psidii]MCX8962567.1 efflux RND transporter periplasmic adaptor subunit [Erwinia psidii]MCX8963890.1 efflux RND transporter periplasmic adaptor subunit [Erwinia psidii]RQM39390.1 efflux RND transporter periplasmic adaptor subunit [Erwinia psidii]